MLKRITTYLSLSSLIVVSLAPTLALLRRAEATETTRPVHIEKKAAPEFASTNGANGTVRVIVQTKGAPTAALDTALTNAHGNKRAIIQ